MREAGRSTRPLDQRKRQFHGADGGVSYHQDTRLPHLFIPHRPLFGSSRHWRCTQPDEASQDLLRRWLADALPEAAPFSRKRGFSVPVAEWNGRQGARLRPLIAAQPGVEEVCRPSAVEALYRNVSKKTGFAAWMLLFYALWHRHHICGLAPQGDVFEALSQAP